MEINLTIRGEEKFRAFVEEHALIGYDAARSDLEEQFLADEKAGRYVLAPEKAKDGQEHVKPCMGVCLAYDAQGTQLGGGKAYLDKGQEPARKDLTIVLPNLRSATRAAAPPPKSGAPAPIACRTSPARRSRRHRSMRGSTCRSGWKGRSALPGSTRRWRGAPPP